MINTYKMKPAALLMVLIMLTGMFAGISVKASDGTSDTDKYTEAECSLHRLLK